MIVMTMKHGARNGVDRVDVQGLVDGFSWSKRCRRSRIPPGPGLTLCPRGSAADDGTRMGSCSR